MPVIDVNLRDFLNMLGEEVPLEEIEERMPMMGVSWEGRTEDGFSIEVFPNRPDMLSIEGLARAYASFTGLRTGLRRYEVKGSGYASIIEERVEAVRPYFVSAVIKEIEFDDALIRSIIQMQEKLHVTHCRKRRKVSIGLHDLEPIRFPVTYTARPSSFRFRPLGEPRTMDLTEILTALPKGREYAWILEGKEEYPILMDAKGMVLSMPPIINSEHTRIDEATDSIYVDVTATDWKAMVEVLNILVTTFADRGAEVYAVANRYRDRVVETPDLSPREMELETAYVNRLLGVDLSDGEVASYLERMGHGVEQGSPLGVLVPCYRTDVMHPIDLVEDVAIAYGYDKFVPEIPEIASPAGEDPLEVFCRRLRNFLVGFGLQETMTFMMTNKRNLFERMDLPVEPVAETENPKTEEYTVIRNRLLPSLMEVLSTNKHHPYPQNLFEVDDVVLLDEHEETGARTARRLAIALCHARANFSEAKAVMNTILGNLGLTQVEIEASDLPCFVGGRALVARVGGIPVCWLGELKPEVLEMWELEMPLAGLEMDVDALYELARRRGSRHP
ncbi:MAG: phenylalanine--tRNA ligase subunit beta [Candidatus Bathyarchaeia archaeon]